MFRKILIANRGEIACRIIKTAKRMGVGAVAVYCDVDRDALHVELADEAVPVGPPPASQSYLVIEKIIAACKETGADSVHPGYGFLSERATFPEALATAGITFIGPNARAIAAMGDKIESKRLAAAAGVSTIPGHLGVIETDVEAGEVAREIGLPVMIKASAGGGGKGMRIAWTEADLAEGVQLARSEARSSFGDDRVFIEKYIENPRHIEIQILGDKHGNVVHLGERECSIQRRNQKIIEEAPSTAVDAVTRSTMGDQAVALAQAVGYDSAGTVEFVMGKDGRFYFLEMNTRLQVEHPVTELVTGIDLVEQMIRIAAGERLAFSQSQIRFKGAAIESRICAEDPYRDFLPSIGRLKTYRPPNEGGVEGGTVRIDSGAVEGSEISIYFDPLVAKLVTHGPDRETATKTMEAALDCYEIDGISHNLPFLSAVMASRRWHDGKLSTSFIAEEYPQGFSGRASDRPTIERLARIALGMELGRRERATTVGRRLNDVEAADADEWVVKIANESLTLRATEAAGSSWRPGESIWSGTVDGDPMTVQVRAAGHRWRLSWRGIQVTATVMSPNLAALEALMPRRRSSGTSKMLRCPMPGLVVSIAVEPGQRVRAGETLAIVEAMKMENVLRADRDLTVKAIVVRKGDSLAVDAVIMEFE